MKFSTKPYNVTHLTLGMLQWGADNPPREGLKRRLGPSQAQVMFFCSKWRVLLNYDRHFLTVPSAEKCGILKHNKIWWRQFALASPPPQIPMESSPVSHNFRAC